MKGWSFFQLINSLVFVVFSGFDTNGQGPLRSLLCYRHFTPMVHCTVAFIGVAIICLPAKDVWNNHGVTMYKTSNRIIVALFDKLSVMILDHHFSNRF